MSRHQAWHSPNPILVIESDDWGAEHFADPETAQKWGTAKTCFDGLETPLDVESLCEILTGVVDCHGRPAVVTANFILGNADFDAMEGNGCSRFVMKSIDAGWNHEADGVALWRAYRQGFAGGVLTPQLHGLLHFDPDDWLRRLQQKNPSARRAFARRMIGEENVHGLGVQSMAPFYFSAGEQIKTRMRHGANAFTRLFGMPSITTIAPCYGWRSPDTEQACVAAGIRAMQGQTFQYLPGGAMVPHYMGQKGPANIIYLTRNGDLEPVDSGTTADQCLRRIADAFGRNAPAILSSHRVNYTSRISFKHRDHGLSVLAAVLKTVKRNYPDVEFLSSDQLLRRMCALQHGVDGR
jgi:hypothetical protein